MWLSLYERACQISMKNNEPTHHSTHTWKQARTKTDMQVHTISDTFTDILASPIIKPIIVIQVIMKASHTLLQKVQTEVWSHTVIKSHELKKLQRMMALQGFIEWMRSSALFCVISQVCVKKSSNAPFPPKCCQDLNDDGTMLQHNLPTTNTPLLFTEQIPKVFCFMI